MIIVIGVLAVISSLVLYCCIRVGSLSDAKIEELYNREKKKEKCDKGGEENG